MMCWMVQQSEHHVTIGFPSIVESMCMCDAPIVDGGVYLQ